MYAISMIVLLVAAMQFYYLYRYLNRGYTQMNQFLSNLAQQDFQTWSKDTAQQDKTLKQINASMINIQTKFKDAQQQQNHKLRHLSALTEHMPMPLLSLYADDSVVLHNKAARKLFANTAIHNYADLKVLGQEFATALIDLANSDQRGERQLVNVSFDGIERQLTLMATEIVTDNHRETLISLFDIQSELDAAQLSAWQSLEGVLTHEIMNSITPVASLAKTSLELTAHVKQNFQTMDVEELTEEINDIHSAVDIVSRRSDGLMQFVQSYRSLTQLPKPQKQELSLQEIFVRTQTLFLQQWQKQDTTIELIIKLESDLLTVLAGPRHAGSNID